MLRMVLWLVVLTYGSSWLRGADVYWTNTAGGNWGTAANWSTGILPSGSDNVFIISNGTYTVALNVDVTISSLILGASSGAQTLSASGRTLREAW